MPLTTIQFAISNGIVRVRLNNPPGNPTSLLFFNELLSVCKTFQQTSELKGIIFDSAGRHFSSGAIVDELINYVKSFPYDQIPPQMLKNLESFLILRKINIPVIAVIRGICFGSGFELALSARCRIATPNALFSLPETTFGLMPGLGGIYSLKQLAGHGKTLELILTGKTLNATEALQYGIIDEIVPFNSIQQRAEELIEQQTSFFKS